MTRSDLMAALAVRLASLNLAPEDTEQAVRLLLDSMSQSLTEGRRIEIRGFGSFSIHQRPPRQGRNPRLGTQVTVPTKWVPHFKPGKILRAAVDVCAT